LNPGLGAFFPRFADSNDPRSAFPLFSRGPYFLLLIRIPLCIRLIEHSPSFFPEKPRGGSFLFLCTSAFSPLLALPCRWARRFFVLLIHDRESFSVSEGRCTTCRAVSYHYDFRTFMPPVANLQLMPLLRLPLVFSCQFFTI